MSDSLLQLGPLFFNHQVQSITIQEQKAVKPLQTTRYGKNFVVDSGKSVHKAEIKLLFTGINEINGESIKDLDFNKGFPKAGIRHLIALFKTCPIISIRNEMLNKAWFPLSGIERDVRDEFYTDSYQIEAVEGKKTNINSFKQMKPNEGWNYIQA